jgi:hypothetical protein
MAQAAPTSPRSAKFLLNSCSTFLNDGETRPWIIDVSTFLNTRLPLPIILYRTDLVTDFQSFDGVYVLSVLNNELTNNVSSALMETSEVLKMSGSEAYQDVPVFLQTIE